MSYTYDAFDRRVSKKVDSDGSGTIDSQEYYVIDETSTSDLESVLVTVDGTGSVTHTYLHGEQVDQIFADENALGQVLWPLTDSQGTVREVATMSTANVLPSIAWNLRYGAFGDITSITDANGVTPAVNPVRYTYTGREWDADADLYYYRACWYDAKAGRFISEDPKGFAAGDANLNRYVKNSSPNAVDPSGLEEQMSSHLRPDVEAIKERMALTSALRGYVSAVDGDERDSRIAKLRKIRSDAMKRIGDIMFEDRLRQWRKRSELDEQALADESSRYNSSSPEFQSLVLQGGARPLNSEHEHLLWDVLIPVDTALGAFETYNVPRMRAMTRLESKRYDKQQYLTELSNRIAKGDQVAYWQYLSATDQRAMLWFGPGGFLEHTVTIAGGVAIPKAQGQQMNAVVRSGIETRPQVSRSNAPRVEIDPRMIEIGRGYGLAQAAPMNDSASLPHPLRGSYPRLHGPFYRSGASPEDLESIMRTQILIGHARSNFYGGLHPEVRAYPYGMHENAKPGTIEFFTPWEPKVERNLGGFQATWPGIKYDHEMKIPVVISRSVPYPPTSSPQPPPEKK